MIEIRRYNLKSLDSYENIDKLTSNYIEYLKRTEIDDDGENFLVDAWTEKLDHSKDDETLTSIVRKMLVKNQEKENLIIRDTVVEKWLKEYNGYSDEEVKLVNSFTK